MRFFDVLLGAGLNSDVSNLKNLMLAECEADVDMARVLNLRDLKIEIGSCASSVRREYEK